MKIGFKQLEKLRRNPKAINEKNAFFGGRSKFTRWQDAIGRYHSNDEDINVAGKYLESSFSHFSDNSINRRELVKYLEHLHEYDNDYKTLQSRKFEFRARFAFDVILGYTLGGQISRIDINTVEDGYSVYFFEKEMADWESELRFPIVQKRISEFFGCRSDEVNVGVYLLNEGKHYNKIYSKNEIAKAEYEFFEIIKQVDIIINK